MCYAETNLVYYAIEKEKQIKRWSKAKKKALIDSDWEKLVKLSKKDFTLRKMIMPEE